MVLGQLPCANSIKNGPSREGLGAGGWGRGHHRTMLVIGTKASKLKNENGDSCPEGHCAEVLRLACRLHRTEYTTTASATTLKTMVAIPAISRVNTLLGLNAIPDVLPPSIGQR
jgi:hypothetical protein